MKQLRIYCSNSQKDFSKENVVDSISYNPITHKMRMNYYNLLSDDLSAFELKKLTYYLPWNNLRY